MEFGLRGNRMLSLRRLLVFAALVSSAFGMASLPSPTSTINAVVWTPMRLRGGASEGAEGFLSRTTVGQVLAQGKDAVGKNLVVCGWAKTMRMQGSGTFAFLELNDGSTFDNIQVVVDKGIPGWDAIEANTHTHTSWHVEGVVVESPGKHKTEQETELKATAVRLLGSSPPEHYPLAKGRLPLEFLRGHPHLRMRTNTHGAVARVRSALAFAVHRFFQQHHFHYVHTPIITTSDCEGAGELFQVTTLVNDLKNNLAKQNATDPASSQNTLVDYSSDFFRKATYLTVSGQLHAEAAALALGKVYTFGPTFRAENSHTSRHLAEFWMIEPEIAFADLSDAMDCAESLLKHALAHAVEAAAADMNFFDTACQKGLGRKRRRERPREI
jgi:asparaginyl-tRNA synthetase